MTTWFLKECPKCSGDLYLDPLVSGDTVKCLQCGLEVKLSFLYLQGKTFGEAGEELKAAEEVVTAKDAVATRRRKRVASLN